MSVASDTIAAIATAPGQAGVGIVRLSGSSVPAIATALLGTLPRPRYAELHAFRSKDGAMIDSGLVLYFPAPASFTGEHVLELHGHGGPVVLQLLLECVLALGARPARPGEFSERAFLNDKIDLVQAEAIADLITSSTAQAARAAVRSLAGRFSEQVHVLAEELTRLRMYIEAAIDFPEEEIDFLSDERVALMLDAVQIRFAELLREAGTGRILHDGLSLVIAGRPNAGKSSLLNTLTGQQAAIVTEIPGTTRDVLREQLQINGIPLHVIDTAGLHDSTDPVEQAGMARAREAIRQADRVLLVVDDRQGFTKQDARIAETLPVAHTLVFNKIDLTGREPGLFDTDGQPACALSAKTGAGLDALRRHLMACAGVGDTVEGALSARTRHLDALRRAQERVASGRVLLEQYRAGDLLAEELRLAQLDLGEITGEVSSDELLGRIFSSFCIGK